MYRIGQRYKFQLREGGIFYTADVLDEDDHMVSIRTVRGEEVVLNKSDIRQSKLLGPGEE